VIFDVGFALSASIFLVGFIHRYVVDNRLDISTIFGLLFYAFAVAWYGRAGCKSWRKWREIKREIGRRELAEGGLLGEKAEKREGWKESEMDEKSMMSC